METVFYKLTPMGREVSARLVNLLNDNFKFAKFERSIVEWIGDEPRFVIFTNDKVTERNKEKAFWFIHGFMCAI